jgi:hypothetical protein
MNKARLNRIERNMRLKTRLIELPIFLEREEDFILFGEALLRQLGQPLVSGGKVAVNSKIIDRIEDSTYLHLKGYENQRIILI